jgi:hypothetical protein
MPKTIDAAYLSSKLNLKPGSAGVVMTNLRSLGLVDEAGKTTQMANLWRDDVGYKEACERILEQQFPDVVEAYPPPDPDRTQLERWFATKTGAGENAAGQMAAFYKLVASADLDGKPSKAERSESNGRKPSANQRAAKSRVASDQTVPVASGSPVISTNDTGGPDLPTLHIDIQVHLAADAPDSQIESLFKNMARYIYGKPSNDQS